MGAGHQTPRHRKGGTMERQVAWGKGYAGKKGVKPYIARITGTDGNDGLRREFLDADRVERAHFNRNRTMITFTYDLTPGLYEVKENGETTLIGVYTKETGGLATWKVREDRLVAMLALMDAGASFEAARVFTKSQPVE